MQVENNKLNNSPKAIANNILESSIINEIIQNIDILDNNSRGKVGEDIVENRIKQLAYAKILYNVYGKDIMYLIVAYTQLGISYIDISYFEQAQEHLLNAFKLIENLNDDINISSKEYQIKILINLAKCYLENGKTSPALSICEKSLKINQTLMGDDHVSNADIYYVLAKINTKMKNYKISMEHLTKMFEIYEKINGFESEKTAKICMEIGQIYELSENITEAVDNYKSSYSIWEKIIKDNNFDVLFTLAIKISELQEKIENFVGAYEVLKNTETKYESFLLDKKKKRINFKKLLIKYSSLNQDLLCYLEELLDLEKILIEVNGEYTKSLAKTSISIATTYFQLGKLNESFEYFEKAEKLFIMFGNHKVAKEIQQKKEQLLYNK